jgi:hypothetical protein
MSINPLHRIAARLRFRRDWKVAVGRQTVTGNVSWPLCNFQRRRGTSWVSISISIAKPRTRLNAND